MKKVAVVINDFQIPQSALDYAISIARNAKSTLFGLFVHGLSSIVQEARGAGHAEQDAVSAFAQRCDVAGIAFKTQIIEHAHLDALIDHSAFTDLMIDEADAPSPAAYSKSGFLANAHCPVLLVNKDFKQVDPIVLTYDDKISGIHAIKSFAYLFPSYSSLPAHFVSAVHENVRGLEYADLIGQWLPLHFPYTTTEILNGNAADVLPEYINSLSNPLIVMGAFGRSSLSRFFKESLANIVLAKTNAPVFIAHY